jgi:hypothetical protein
MLRIPLNRLAPSILSSLPSRDEELNSSEGVRTRTGQNGNDGSAANLATGSNNGAGEGNGGRKRRRTGGRSKQPSENEESRKTTVRMAGGTAMGAIEIYDSDDGPRFCLPVLTSVNPTKYMRQRTCVGPGWKTVRRVK